MSIVNYHLLIIKNQDLFLNKSRNQEPDNQDARVINPKSIVKHLSFKNKKWKVESQWSVIDTRSINTQMIDDSGKVK